MPTVKERIKKGIGQLNPFSRSPAATPAPSPGTSPQSSQTNAPPGNATGAAPPNGQPPERERDVEAVLDNVAFDVPTHAKFLNHTKNVWRVMGPIAFVVFTSWEVYYYMNHFMGQSDLPSKILLWGITLLIEIPFMIATFDQSERKRVRAEKKAMGVPFQDADTTPSIIGWGFLALVNVTGQIAFLLYITQLGANPFDFHNPAVIGLWLFVCVRVAGVIMGDSYTAFFLRPDETTVERTIRAETARGKGQAAIKENRAELRRIDAESDAKVRRIEMGIRREERDEVFIEQWNQMNVKQALERQRHFMRLESQQYRIEEIEGPSEEPNTDQLNGL